MMLSRFSLGIGDRFAHQGVPQLAALIGAKQAGVEITPVWNKSHREHSIIGSRPSDTRRAADCAVAAAPWTDPYFVDADHITMKTASGFLEACDFFTLDVADALAQNATADEAHAFVRLHPELTDPGSAIAAARFLPAAREAGRIYRFIRERKTGDFVTEVSMDETGTSHSPLDLHVFLAALAEERVPVNTVAPRFCGEFHKGVDYEGDLDRFEREFAAHIAVLRKAVAAYGLPGDLKLSVHSGSDKFSLYAPIRRVLDAAGAGLHLKTAGTTWLEELIGLAEAGGDGLDLAKDVYAQAYARREELCAPYAAVVRIREARLPFPGEVRSWTAEQFTGALRHDPRNPAFNPDFRQLLHVGFRTAAEMGQRYLLLLDRHADAIGRNVTFNLLERHIRPLFL
jgi:tagaturonate epimerase